MSFPVIAFALANKSHSTMIFICFNFVTCVAQIQFAMFLKYLEHHEQLLFSDVIRRLDLSAIILILLKYVSANIVRFALRIVSEIVGIPKIVDFEWCC